MSNDQNAIMDGLLGLIAESKEAKTSKVARKKLTAEAKQIAQSSAQLLEFKQKQRWRDLGLVLLVHRKTCECGAVHETANDCLFLLKQHPSLGRHYIEVTSSNPLELYRLQNRMVEYRDTPIQACTSCFDPLQAARTDGQLTLAF